jgi:PAS domain S-box-containing protein
MNWVCPSIRQQSLQKSVGLKHNPSINVENIDHQTASFQSFHPNEADLEGHLSVLESLPCIHLTISSTHTILSVSQYGTECLGYEPGELTQRSISAVLAEEDQANCQEKLTKVQHQTHQRCEWTTRLVRKDGSQFWVTAKAALIAGTKSSSVISLVCEDISEVYDTIDLRQQAEVVIRQNEMHLNAIVEGNLDAFFLLQTERNEAGVIQDFTVINVNSKGEKLLSMPKQVAIGKKISELPIFNHNSHCFPTCVQVLQTGIAQEDEFSLSLPFVATLWLRQKVVPLADGVALTLRDITQRRQAEEALQQQFLGEKLVGAIAQRIHQSLNLEETLQTTVEEVRQFLSCDRVIIFRIHPDGSGVIVVESVDSQWMSISGISINDRYFAEIYVQLYQQGRVQVVEDIDAAQLTDCHRDLLAKFQVKANLVVPIVHEEQLWGLLVAQQCQASRQWQTLEIEMLRSLATQAAIAIQQSELYQQAQTEIRQRQQAEETLRQQYQRESLVGAITQRIRQSLNLEEILNATVAEVRQVLQVDRVVIFRFDPDWSGNVVVESVASPQYSILGENIYDPCFEESYIEPYRQGRVKAIEDIHTAQLNQCHVELLSKFQVRANLVVPILQNESTLQLPLTGKNSPDSNGQKHPSTRLWGLLIAHHCCEPRHWQPYETDLLTSLASQVAIAIQQSQLYEQAQYQAKREQVLNQLTQAIRHSLDLETIFSTATQEIEKLLQVDRTHIIQYVAEQNLWQIVAESCQGVCFPKGLGVEIPDENNEIAQRLKQLEVIRIDDSHNFQGNIDLNTAQRFPGAWLLVPLRSGSSVWGALGLVREAGPYRWRDAEVELMGRVADQLAIALQQAELYQQSRSATEQARTQAQQLKRTLIELQKTQAHLVQSEKMSSLGQLVAGVAHEINNPVSFIYGNLIHAREYTQDILGLLELYQEQYSSPTPEIQSEIEAIDLEFLMGDLPKLMDSMQVGAERICEIVSALRNFSRLAEAEMKAVDLHDGLDSTLMILHNRLKASGGHPEIQVIREYGHLPKVECYAGQLNQVFMNLLSNAIDAIDEHNQTRSPEHIKAYPSAIRIQTELRSSTHVVIRIIDNGPGMSENVQARLFDPFFTTKPVGTGTGLGLSISYQIVVEKHGGQLHCHSQLGKGTEFVIEIPVWQEHHNDSQG